MPQQHGPDRPRVDTVADMAGGLVGLRPALHYRGAVRHTAVVGLGRMGLPIAQRLLAAGPVTGYDIDVSRRDAARTAGVPTADTLTDAVARAETVVAVLPGAAVQRSALWGPAGGALLSLMRPGQLLLELTSGDPRLADDIHHDAQARGVAYVAAPMGGGPEHARTGTLTFFVAGPSPAVERATPTLLLLAATERILRVGTLPRDAQTAKLLINALWFGQAALATEVLLLGAKLGLQPSALLGTLDASAAGAAILHDSMPRALDGDYLETFPLDAVVEELDNVTDLAAQSHLAVRALDLIATMHRDARAQLGPVDGELRIVDALEREAGIRLGEIGHRLREGDDDPEESG